MQLKDLRDGARDLRHFQRVGQPRAVVVARGREKYLGLVLQAAERLAVHDAIAIVLKRRTHIVFGLVTQTSTRLGAFRRLRRQNLPLARLEVLSDACQRLHLLSSF